MNASREFSDLKDTLEARGLHAALGFLNARTPHRFTGVYRFDGDTLRNVCLFDRIAPETLQGDDLSMNDAYCAIVGRTGKSLEFADARTDGRFAYKPAVPIISYCGVLLRDAAGKPFGTLCHYDFQPCQHRSSDVPLLEAIGPLFVGATCA